jgi:hypothetical protein
VATVGVLIGEWWRWCDHLENSVEESEAKHQTAKDETLVEFRVFGVNAVAGREKARLADGVESKRARKIRSKSLDDVKINDHTKHQTRQSNGMRQAVNQSIFSSSYYYYFFFFGGGRGRGAGENESL